MTTPRFGNQEEERRDATPAEPEAREPLPEGEAIAGSEHCERCGRDSVALTQVDYEEEHAENVQVFKSYHGEVCSVCAKALEEEFEPGVDKPEPPSVEPR